MAIEINWLIENHVCLVNFTGALSAADMEAYDQAILSKLDQASDRLHFIADVSQIESLPPLGSLVTLRHLRHSNLGRGLTVGLTNNPLGRFVISMGTQVVGIKQKDFGTVVEARAYLRQMEGLNV